MATTYGREATAYSCLSCGGHFITDNYTTATFCVYCHSPSVTASRAVEDYRPERLLPFEVGKEEAMQKMLSFCSSYPLVPKDFTSYAKNGEITGLYIPFWLFDCHIQAELIGQADSVTHWSDSDYNYTRTDAYHVERGAVFSVNEAPATGSSQRDSRLMQGLEPFDFSRLRPFSMEHLSGYYAESYGINAEEAAQALLQRLDSQVRHRLADMVQGYSSFQTHNFAAKHRNLRHSYVLLPIWLLMTSYNGQSYVLAVNGQSGKTVGILPRDNSKLLLFGVIAMVITTLICFIGGIFV